MGVVGNADAAGVGDAFQPGRDIDAVAKNVVVVDDDVADMDADAEFDAFCLGDVDIAQAHRALHLDRAAHRVHRAAELDQHAVAGGFDDAAAIFGDLGIDQRLAEGFQAGQRALLVDAHQPAIAGDVRREDCRQPSLHPGARHTQKVPLAQRRREKRSLGLVQLLME